MVLGMACFVGSYLLFGFARGFSAYCGGAVLSRGLAYGYGGMIPLTLVISRWFPTGRGFALGMAAAGSGISTIFAPPLITGAIQALGLSAAFLWRRPPECCSPCWCFFWCGTPLTARSFSGPGTPHPEAGGRG